MQPKEIKRLEKQLAENEERQKKAADEAKALRRKKAAAERNMRTHRLCLLGAMLEKFLKVPDLLTDSDIERILTKIFTDPDTMARMDNALEFRRTHPAAEDEGSEA